MITFKPGPEQDADLKLYARALGVSVGELVRRSVDLYLDQIDSVDVRLALVERAAELNRIKVRLM